MNIRNQIDLEVAYAKISFLQGVCKAAQERPGRDARVDQLALQSLQSQIRDLQVGISLYEKKSGRAAAA